jgi:CRISPR-associated protein Csm3
MNRINHDQLLERYTIRGEITMDTALHVGTGWQTSFTDKPILRDAAGRPFIPGSSIKGAFRACIERLAPNFGMRSCALSKGNPTCFTTHESVSVEDPGGDKDDSPKAKFELSKGDAWRLLVEYMDRNVSHSGDADSRARCGLKLLDKSDWIGRPTENPIREEELIELLEQGLCDTCLLFGSPFNASKVTFNDLPVVEPWYELVEVRDGVGIDRDSNRAMEKIKYDFEAVPAQTRFAFQMTVDNPVDKELGLVAAGLLEMRNGFLRLGGIRSRGLGQCHLTLCSDEEGWLGGIWRLDAKDPKSLQSYLLGDRDKPGVEVALQKDDLNAWLEMALETLIEGGQ